MDTEAMFCKSGNIGMKFAYIPLSYLNNFATFAFLLNINMLRPHTNTASSIYSLRGICGSVRQKECV